MRTIAHTRLCLFGPLALAAIVLAACANGPSAARRTDPAAVARGEALARRSCAVCHGVGLSDASSFPGAAAFRDMRMDYNAISYERRMVQLHAARPSMPPAHIGLAEVEDIIAYAQSLRSAAARDARP